MIIQLTADFLCWMTRSYPSFRGRWRLMHWLHTNDSWYVQHKPCIVKTRWGHKIVVDPAEFIGRCIFIEGVFEQDCAIAFHRLLSPGENVIDIGANIGYFSLLGSSLVGDTGHVYSFEASPKVIEQLKYNISLNGISNITCFQKAAADRNESVQFYLSSDLNRGLSSLRTIGHAVPSISVESLTIDSILETLPRISLVKIDVEGAEHKVLQGMVNLINRDRPSIILEMTDAFLRQMGSSAREVFGMLGDIGYRKYQIHESNLAEVVEPPAEQYNMIFLYTR